MQFLALATKTFLLLLEIQPQESVHLINLVGSRPFQILQLLWHLVEVLTELIDLWLVIYDHGMNLRNYRGLMLNQHRVDHESNLLFADSGRRLMQVSGVADLTLRPFDASMTPRMISFVNAFFVIADHHGRYRILEFLHLRLPLLGARARAILDRGRP